MDNAARDKNGNIIGFKCFKCGNIYDRMWGTVCNQCKKGNALGQRLLKEQKKKWYEKLPFSKWIMLFILILIIILIWLLINN